MSLPRGVVALGLVSLFMDISSEMVHAILPIYLTAGLGASAAMVGLIEGLAQGTAQLTKLFSGALSDAMGRRKPLALLGYGLSALVRPIFAWAPDVGWVLAARVADRLGKGIRGTPRDAMVADMVPPQARGAAFGLRQSLDSFGAFAGPLLVMALMLGAGASMPQVFALAILPAAVAVAILALAVTEPEPAARAKATGWPLAPAAVRQFPVAFWGAVGLACLMTAARISDAFLILRAAEAGVALWALPLVLVVMNAVDMTTSWPVGALADRIGKRGLLLMGFGVLALANLVLAWGAGLGAVFAGIALWGLHMGLTQGLLAALVAEHAPPALRGTGFGLFNLGTGLALIAGNGAAGLAWMAWGPEATFLGAAVLAGGATVLGLALGPRR